MRVRVILSGRFRSRQLRACVEQFFTDNKEETVILEYQDGAAILAQYPNRPDLLLMDIDMPRLNGVQSDRLLRG